MRSRLVGLVFMAGCFDPFPLEITCHTWSAKDTVSVSSFHPDTVTLISHPDSICVIGR
jgi:hypothetical protein